MFDFKPTNMANIHHECVTSVELLSYFRTLPPKNSFRNLLTRITDHIN